MFLPDPLGQQGMLPLLYRVLIFFLRDVSKTKEKNDIFPYLKLTGYILPRFHECWQEMLESRVKDKRRFYSQQNMNFMLTFISFAPSSHLKSQGEHSIGVTVKDL